MTQTPSKPAGTDRRPRDLLLWGSGPSALAIAPLLEEADLRVVGVGSPPREGLDKLPEGWAEAERYDDPRLAVQACGASLALFTQSAALDDPGLIALCAQSGIRALSLEPSPTTLAAWGPKDDEGDRVRVLPLLGDSVLHADALDALEPIGTLIGASVRMVAPASLGGLPARLYDAMHLLHRHLGVPEMIDGSCPRARVGGSGGLGGLTGALHAHARYPSGGATLAISDGVTSFARDALLEGERGVLRLTDEGFTVVGEDGSPIDRSAGSGEHPLVEQLRRLVDARLPDPDRYRRSEVLAMCEATALSVRTGQPERPREVLSMLGR